MLHASRPMYHNFSFVSTLLCWIGYALRYTFLSIINSIRERPTVSNQLWTPFSSHLRITPPLMWHWSTEWAGVSHTVSIVFSNCKQCNVCITGWLWFVSHMMHSTLQGIETELGRIYSYMKPNILTKNCIRSLHSSDLCKWYHADWWIDNLQQYSY